MLIVDLLLVVLVLACILASGFFSGYETALISADRTAIHVAAGRGEGRAALAERLVERTEALLSTMLVGTNVATVTGTSLATLVVADALEAWDQPLDESVVTTLVMTPLVLIFGEIVPKSIGRASADAVTVRGARLLAVADRLMRPIAVVARRIAEAALALLGDRPVAASPYVTREELMALADIGEEHGLLASEERQMIRSILELRDRPVSTVMVPLAEMVSLGIDATVADLEEAAATTGFSRFPVYEGPVDNVVGVGSVVSVLRAGLPEEPAATPLAPYVRREVTYVPETKSVGELLRELRYSEMPMAIVVDEHGGVVGLATAEDLVAEVVGHIRDARREWPHHVAAGTRSDFQCDARMSVDVLAETLGQPIPKEGFETVGGLVMKLAGEIPREGETVQLGPYTIEVVEADPRRIRRLRVFRADRGRRPRRRRRG
ncbi:MAG: hemolysin family protein [Candidatus Brocadiia bacterium]